MRATLTSTLRVAAPVIFYGWNAVFIALVYFGLIPFHAQELQDLLRDEGLPPAAVGLLVAAALVPPLATALGLLRLRRQPGALLNLFYGVEVPMLLMSLYGLACLRDPGPGLLLLLAAYGLGATGLVLALLTRRPEAPGAGGPTLTLALTALHAAGSFFGLYVGGLLAFFLLPLAAKMHASLGLLSLPTVGESVLRADPIQLLAFTLFALTLTLILFLPAALVVQPVLRWWRGFTLLRRAGAGAAAGALSAVVFMGFAAAFTATAQQPQAAAFAATQGPVAGPEAQARWRADAARLRAGLINAYLQRFRYLERASDFGDLRAVYADSLGLSPNAAQAVNDAFVAWAHPFFFDDRAGDMPPWQAALRFRDFFDDDLDADARVEIQRATALAVFPFQGRGGPASAADAGAPRVHLEAQELRVREGAGYADVELHEVLRNTDREDREVIYAFELPPTAALTGLWLGASADRAEAFPYVVAPRGAARAVYQQEVRRRVDPALLEQLGPRQYRLRVYPVLGQTRHDTPAPPLHVWLRYQTLPGAEGWPTPTLLSARNVYWDEDTAFDPPRPGDTWWPEALPMAQPRPDGDLQVSLHAGMAVRFRPAPGRLAPPRGRRVLVVVDRSYSMVRVQEALRDTLDALSARLGPGNTLDALLPSAAVRAEATLRRPLADLTPADLAPFGGHSVWALFEAARAEVEAYDAVVFVTDGGARAIDLAPPHPYGDDAPRTGAYPDTVPLFVLPLGPREALPDTLTAAILASGGDQVRDVDDLTARLAWPDTVPEAELPLALADGWAVTLVAAPHVPAQDEPAALAAAWFIRGHARLRAQPDLVTLDRLHAAAVARSVVTPYSSLLVLVDERQREALRQASGAEDRFERATEVDEPLPGVGAPMGLSGAPEPGTWALLGLAGAGAWLRRRRARGEGANFPLKPGGPRPN
jgi:putative PEP-CTERM system integral membrane protein